MFISNEAMFSYFKDKAVTSFGGRTFVQSLRFTKVLRHKKTDAMSILFI